MTRRQRPQQDVSQIHERSLVEDGIGALEKEETLYVLSAADVGKLQKAFFEAGSEKLAQFLANPANLRLIEKQLMSKAIDRDHPTAHIKRQPGQSKREANGRI